MNTSVGVRDEAEAPLAAIAVDEIAGEVFQRIKLDVGAEGASAPVVGALPVSGPLTDDELRDAPVLVEGVVAIVGPVATGGVTDAELRAVPLPVSGTVSTGALTDTQLRATAVPVTMAAAAALTASAPTFASVGVASAQALAANATRRGLVLVNRSANVVSVAFGANPAVLDAGITLDPGGAFTMTPETMTTAAVNAIADVASSRLAIQ